MDFVLLFRVVDRVGDDYGIVVGGWILLVFALFFYPLADIQLHLRRLHSFFLGLRLIVNVYNPWRPTQKLTIHLLLFVVVFLIELQGRGELTVCQVRVGRGHRHWVIQRL